MSHILSLWAGPLFHDSLFVRPSQPLKLRTLPVNLPAVEQLLDYFESTWINGTFPVSTWNKRELRTSNYKAEGWHNSLNQAVRKSHPNVYELLTTLKEEQAATNEEELQREKPGYKRSPKREKETLKKT